MKRSWTIIDHVCRVCLGRLLVDHDHRHVRCSNCGAEATDTTRASSLCCCGTKLRTGKSAGLRCLPNPQCGPDFPAEIVAAEVPDTAPVFRHTAGSRRTDDLTDPLFDEETDHD